MSAGTLLRSWKRKMLYLGLHTGAKGAMDGMVGMRAVLPFFAGGQLLTKARKAQ